jgi:hypothetical protein
VIGAVELLLTLLFALGGGGTLILLFVFLRRGAETGAEPRAPLPVIPTVLASLTIPAALVASLGLGGRFVESVLLPRLAGVGQLLLTDGRDPFAAHVHASWLLAVWLALPGTIALGVLLASRRRSWIAALGLAVSGWLGFGVGIGAGLWLIPTATAGIASSQLPGAMVSLVDLVKAVVAGLTVLGVAGACAPIVGLLAMSSWPALRRMLLATAVMPAVALAVAALATPPDALSQLLVGATIGSSWLVGLAAGAVIRVLRRDRGRPRARNRSRALRSPRIGARAILDMQAAQGDTPPPW